MWLEWTDSQESIYESLNKVLSEFLNSADLYDTMKALCQLLDPHSLFLLQIFCLDGNNVVNTNTFFIAKFSMLLCLHSMHVVHRVNTNTFFITTLLLHTPSATVINYKIRSNVVTLRVFITSCDPTVIPTPHNTHYGDYGNYLSL